MKKLFLPTLLGIGALFLLHSCGGDVKTTGNNDRQEQHVEQEINYASVKIGTQEWMETNLDLAFFCNGDEVTEAKTSEEWIKAGENGTPAWCYYAQENKEKYGKLYNWFAVIDERGLAPDGWHVPTDTEWNVLEEFLGTNIGKKLKSNTDWKSDGGGDNSSGFNALPCGARSADGNFNLLGIIAYWWSSTEKNEKTSYVRGLANDSNDNWRGAFPKQGAFSIRCVKDKADL
tara:strand:+ start:305 stop:997 length:693 start_codon:yes stop_codon:yes gene_type:complete